MLRYSVTNSLYWAASVSFTCSGRNLHKYIHKDHDCGFFTQIIKSLMEHPFLCQVLLNVTCYWHFLSPLLNFNQLIVANCCNFKQVASYCSCVEGLDMKHINFQMKSYFLAIHGLKCSYTHALVSWSLLGYQNPSSNYCQWGLTGIYNNLWKL